MNEVANWNAQLDPAFVEEWGTRFGDAWNDHDPEAIAELCSEDVVWNDAALPGPAHGRKGVAEFARFTFAVFPDFHVVETAESLFISPAEPVVLVPYRMTGSRRGTDDARQGDAVARFSLAGIDQWTFRGERLCAYSTYYDKDEMDRQLRLTGAGQSVVR
ncbi:MAG TPA: nuclear transport factor 2 family protein [Solirubrobacterales bacterium]|nr:nuclear transport factor 2 family protein [Solirubrobacterales bacterium]